MNLPAHDRRPICFTLMPFGIKRGVTGVDIDFDAVYATILQPAIEGAGLQCVRADEERVGGIIHKPMFERLVLCDFAVADLTTANANVYYELGVRHAVRPFTTVLVFAAGIRLPFDLGPLRGTPYRLDDGGAPAAPDEDRDRLMETLSATVERSDPVADSPIFSLLDGMRAPDISRLKADVFRDEVEYSSRCKVQLRTARRSGRDAVKAVLDGLGDVGRVEVGVLIDVLLSFRAVEAYDDMVDLVERRMGKPVRAIPMVQEQYAFALNRLDRSEDAEQVLVNLIEERGPSSETYGLLGRVYKDRWEAARRDGKDALARGLLQNAIEAYAAGFEADWRDAYPGVNAVELMSLREPPDSRLQKLLPVVRYAAERRLAGRPDYWDHATVLELAVLEHDEPSSREALERALATVREAWEPKSTLASLRRLRTAAERLGNSAPWLREIERELAQAASAASN